MDTFYGLLLGVFGSLIASVIWSIAGGQLLSRLEGSTFNLSGTWVTDFEPASPKGTYSIELLTIRQTGDRVKFYLENYNNKRRKILRLRGIGVYRSSQLSAIYYFLDSSCTDSGAFILRSRGVTAGETVLTGIYAQVVDRESEKGVFIETENYTLRKVKVPLKRQIYRLLRGASYMDYNELAQEILRR